MRQRGVVDENPENPAENRVARRNVAQRNEVVVIARHVGCHALYMLYVAA